MKKSRYSEAQIVLILKQAANGRATSLITIQQLDRVAKACFKNRWFDGSGYRQ